MERDVADYENIGWRFHPNAPTTRERFVSLRLPMMNATRPRRPIRAPTFWRSAVH